MRVNFQCHPMGVGQIAMEFRHRQNSYELSHVRLTEEQANQEARLIDVYVQVKDTQSGRFVDEPNADVVRWAEQAVILNSRGAEPQTYIANALLVLKAWVRQHTF